MTIFDDMDFFVTTDRFIIEPNGSSEKLIINRITQEISLEAKKQVSGIRGNRRICGLLGTINLTNGLNLIVATHRILVGVINGQVIWQLAGYDIIPYAPSSEQLNGNEKTQNETYLNMLRLVLDTPFFYFSYSYDLTHSLQRLHSMAPETFTKLGLAERADPRFVWNRYLLDNFGQSPHLRQFALPLVHGFVAINQLNVNGNQFSWILISRRSTERAGTRLFSRGIDERGFCSNFVETEQIVEHNGDKASFVQTRGSIPLFWSQTPNLKYKPKPTISDGRDHLVAATRHIDAQLQYYGRQVLVNLIDHCGSEQRLETGFADMIGQLANPSIRYESFDFHSECRKMRWDRLEILIDRLAHEQDEFGLFHLRRDGALLASQDGTFRTNCIDCLDRTNVVQSMLAKRSLKHILTKLNILLPGQSIDSTAGLSSLYKNIWADNADLVSTQYSGTGALKTDFTRTGKRTIQGAMQDGVNSLIRYYKNNFRDGRRQDGIDLFLGNYVVQFGEGKSVPSPLNTYRGWKHGTFPSLLMFASVMFLSSAVLPREYNTENMLFLLFWGAVVGLTLRGIFKYGSEFVDLPKLIGRSTKTNDA